MTVMINLCSKCRKLLEEGDKVSFVASGVYHKLPSIKAWAIDNGSLEADVRSIRHLECNVPEGD